ncbi:hypothetical protein HYFRA_00008740 [Hymenoscyphus fraxineus]|uniref:BTB domain-containing protein n=1 Tax=Hymenoscyphus fraxineus TaxID=746836 RepID=A0A9N9L1B4_9HELO|nr:hypothetical protein HYFRA_00008740 [Hymenoscyphus fraxineus]
MPQPPKKRAKLSTAAGDDAVNGARDQIKKSPDNQDTGSSRGEGEDETTNVPKVYRLPGGLKPDVRLLVFDQEYHVHSTILKLHSNYFRRFLDSPDKTGEPASANFQYEYATVVDDDGTWALEPANKIKDPVFTFERLHLLEKGGGISPMLEGAAFEALISAMYNRPYKVETTEDIVDLTNVAGFYCALPIVSATINGQLFESQRLLFGSADGRHVSSDPVDLLIAARKLRHKRLFHDCLIHVVSQFARIESENGNELQTLQNDKEIYALVLRHHRFLCKKIMKVQHEQIRFMQSDQHDWKPVPVVQSYMNSMPENNATYFYAIYAQLPIPRSLDARKCEGPSNNFRLALDDLLENELWLDQMEEGPACGIYENRFLSCDADKIEYPWNEDEVDW